MIMSAVASVFSGASEKWQLTRLLQAQRSADQASQNARTLQSEAADAREEARRAEQTARSLEIKASEAQGQAIQANQHLQTAKSYREGQVFHADVYSVTSRSTQGAQGVQHPQVATTSPPAAVGSIVNTTA